MATTGRAGAHDASNTVSCVEPWRRVERTGERQLRLDAGRRLEDDAAALGEHARQMFGERHAQGFNHLVRRIDEDDVVALVRPGEVAHRVGADDPALQAELLEVALDRP